MTKNTKTYHFYRFITVLLTTLMLPFGTFVGFQFGAGNTEKAILFLAIQCALTFVQSYIWWFTLEKEGRR